MAVYTGFSTVANTSQKKFVLNDNDLIKQDLLNAFQTRRGQRVMQPKFGCIVWEKLFETISEGDVDDISKNMQSIINADPRVNLISLDITPEGNNLTVTLVLFYVTTNQTEQLIIKFNSDSETISSF